MVPKKDIRACLEACGDGNCGSALSKYEMITSRGKPTDDDTANEALERFKSYCPILLTLAEGTEKPTDDCITARGLLYKALINSGQKPQNQA